MITTYEIKNISGEKIRSIKEKLITRFVWLLPKLVIYWCAIRLFAIATTGKYSDTVASELTVFDAVKRLDYK